MSTIVQPVFSFEERQRFAREAYFEMLRRVSVLVLPRGHLGSIGSGILVATASGRPCVLTARHVVDGVTDFKARLSGQSFGEIDDAVDAFVLGPERTGWGADLNNRDVDVALLSLRKRDHARIAEAIGNAHHDVTIADTPEVRERDQIVITGFPAALVRPLANAQVGIASLRYFTAIQGRDVNGRFEASWDNAERIPDGEYAEHLPVPTGIFDMVHPGGISGGGLWRVRGPSGPTEILSPTRCCQLIGISSALDSAGKVELAEAVDLWRAWLIESLAQIDSRYSNSSES